MVDDDLIATPGQCQAVVRLLALSDPMVREMAVAHENEYGELLVTVFLGDLARMAFSGPVDAALLSAVNDLLVVGNAAVRNVLLTGFVEGVPAGLDPRVVSALPNPLGDEVARGQGMG